MDKIELHVDQHAGAVLGQPWHAIFGVAGGTIGRGGQNKLVLPDVDADVARVHAMVRLDSEHAYIANLCERRAVWVDGLEVRSGQEVRLPLGAQVRIGAYVLKAAKFGAPKVSNAETQARLGLESLQSGSAEPVAEAASRQEAVAGGPSKLAATPNPWADIEPQVRDAYALPSSAAPGALQPAPPAPAIEVAADSPFAVLGVMQRASTPAPAPQGAGSSHRPMLIPPDFDPFARDLKRDANSKDPWAGGLPATSLAEVANLKNDGLLQGLPLTGRFESSMDNPAHPGLPRRLEPSNEVDPLVLFHGVQEDAVACAASSQSPVRGNDLVQLFSMPKEAAAAAVGGSAPQRDAVPAPDCVQHVTDALGLRRTQGLDLSLFGSGADSSARLEPALHTAPLPQPQSQPQSAMAQASLPGQVPKARSFVELPETATWPIAVPPAAPEQGHARRAPSGTATPDALAQAFLEGAGLASARVDLNLSPEFMRSFGEAFRVAVEGTIDLLAARSEIKREFRAGVTIMASGANNPLKFLPNADGVLMQLAGQGFPGFMKPVPAMKEAYRDLQVHQLGLMAGIRAAYTAALTRFDPVELEKRPRPRFGLLGSFSSMKRKAALWDDYKQGYNSIRQYAEDDLKAFSGRTFVEAYEAAADTAKEAL